MNYRYKEQIYYPDYYHFTKEGTEWYQLAIFQYNISQILADLAENPNIFLRSTVSVKECTSFLYDELEQRHVEQADLKRPVILIEIAPDSYHLADGNHRVKKAQQLGIKTLPAYYLTSEQAVRYMDSEESYARYLNYWNEKVACYDQAPYYEGMLHPVNTVWKERILESEYIRKQIMDCLNLSKYVEIYDAGQWFTLFRLRDKIFVGESDAHEASVRCAAPIALDLRLIETALIYFEKWMMKDKDTIAEAKKYVKNVRYAMALIRVFSYREGMNNSGQSKVNEGTTLHSV